MLGRALTETLLALGRAPVGISLPDSYAGGIVASPHDVVDAGLRDQPDFDGLHALAHDLPIVTPAYAVLRAPQQRIAPMLAMGAYMGAACPFEVCGAQTSTMTRPPGAPGHTAAPVVAAQPAFATATGVVRGLIQWPK
ncbi:TroA family protein [Burkholderia metallica]|uniref:hypothetical protein n=1 Tax=Burkholderia metallica TaxID=488729 RepID=UPI001CF157D6|nr:hypothetical protein [Burkholderia metallica]MCA7997724.1 hypothetical protein [Burkholderia metallica]